MDLSAVIHLLGDLLGQVITEQESPAVFELEERIRLLAKARRSEHAQPAGELSQVVAGLDPEQARAVAAAFSLYFDLVNLAEESSRVDALREQEQARAPEPIKDSIGEAVAALQAAGVTPSQLAALLPHLKIELVLTAHPTEAKRRTVLSKLQRISETLEALKRPDRLPRERAALQFELHAELTAFWLTERTRTAQPSVTDEARTGLYFIDSVFWEALPRIHAELTAALHAAYPGLTLPGDWFTLGSWIGGDRDGNPNVTAAVTAETLRLHRGLAIEKHRRALHDLARRLSISSNRRPLPPELQAWLDNRRPLPPHVAFLEQRYASEPYRWALSLLAEELGEASRDDMTAHLLSDRPHSARVQLEEFLLPLEAMRRALPDAVAGDRLSTVISQFEIFGLQAARLDLREDSARINAAVAETLRALQISPDFEQASPPERLALLARLLQEPAPRLAPHPGVSPETAETWALFHLLQRARRIYGPSIIGPFIISMTHSAADLLAVLLLAHWTGVAGYGVADSVGAVPLPPGVAVSDGAVPSPGVAVSDGAVPSPGVAVSVGAVPSPGVAVSDGAVPPPGVADSVGAVPLPPSAADGLAVAPLFETITDLQDAAHILDELFSLDLYRRHLSTCGDHQLVMIGYSDSNKDGGYLAANWALYAAQESVARVARAHGIRLTLFHGRGGTVARGGGPANRAIRAQPPGTVNGRFRLTEQGEVIAARYSHPEIAHRHLEQIVNAVLLASFPQTCQGSEVLPSEWRQALDAMAAAAGQSYRRLVFETPGFLDFWRDVTPLAEIKRLQIGSRPAARGSGAEAVTKIRAIPWVFSWMQTRFNLPGWYGLGSGLEHGLAEFGLARLQEMYANWPFLRAVLDNAEMSLLKADMEIAGLYVALAADQETAAAIYAEIRAEFERTRQAILRISGHQALMDSDPIIQRSVVLRNPYVDPLNYIQVEMLRRLRSQANRAAPDAETLRRVRSQDDSAAPTAETLRRVRSQDDSAAPTAETLRTIILLTVNGIAAGLRNTG